MTTILRQIIRKKTNGIRGTLLASLTFVLSISASAQIQQAWVAKYNNGITNGNHQALKMTLDPSGNIYVVGVSQNANTNTGYVTIKYAPNGNALWTARYDSTNFPSATPTGFALDSTNNVIVTGSAVTVKYDSNGNQLWIAPYTAQAIAVDSAQNICITGASSNFTTVKLSPVGTNLWTQTLALYSSTNLSQVIAIDSSNDVYVAGGEGYPQIVLGGAVDTYFRFAITKYDSTGNQLWEEVNESYGDGVGVQVHSLRLDSIGNAYVADDYLGLGIRYQIFRYNNDGSAGWYVSNPTHNGYSILYDLALDQAANTVVTGEAPSNFKPNNAPLFSYATYKVNTNGTVLWGNEYPQVALSTNVGTSITFDLANNIYVTGYSPGTNSTSDIATLKYDPNGNQIWVQRYDGPGHSNDAGNSIAVDKTGNVYVAGYETETNGFTEMVLIKYSPVTVQKQSNGNFILQAYGSPGENFDIQASTNLQSWQDLGHVIADTNGFAQFADTNASNFPSRFYFTSPQ
jgi:hypothetical protein